MKNKVIDFLKKNWLPLVMVCLLFFVGYKLFYSRNKVNLLHKDVIEKEYENKQLTKQLEVQKGILDSLKKESDSLYVLWEKTPHIKIVEKIKDKYNEKRKNIINANDDEQFSIFSSWLSKESSNR